MRLTQTLLCAATMLALAACSKPEPAAAPEPVTAPETSAPAATTPEASTPAAASTAKVTLKATEGNKVAGELSFMSMEGGVHVTGTITGLAPGEHGLHIHEKGDCSAPDGASAGGHFNPDGVDHGQITAQVHHAGDSNNITADADGNAPVNQMLSANVDIGKGDKYDIVGKGVIVHEKADDYKTQPTGDAGGRLACGVIEVAA
ncbi:MAG: superoxide dismutase family protein, partial [Pseudoxanthomonas sp.]